ncbi:MAG: NfeD family protein, partial [Pyrinomonadaceae bacterium]
RTLLVIGICTVLCLVVAGVIAALSHRKKARTGDIKLLGEIAVVDKELDPEGTVLVGGELWRARSINDAVIPPHSKVEVVGFLDHMALVKVCG